MGGLGLGWVTGVWVCMLIRLHILPARRYSSTGISYRPVTVCLSDFGIGASLDFSYTVLRKLGIN